MARKTTQRPTDVELSILRVLWQRGPSTVRAVQTELERTAPTGYTTVLKMLQIMTEKGLVVRDEAQRAHVYTADRPQEEVQTGLVDDLVQRAFGGSASELVLRALSARRASSGELAQIRRMLDDMERGDQR